MISLLSSASALLLVLVLILPTIGCTKKKTPETIAKQGWVTDSADLLPQEDEDRISASLAAFEQETCHQVLVLIVQTLDGETIQELSHKTAVAWHIGQQGLDNGILLTIAVQDHKMRIETGQTFEWFIGQDGGAEKILRENIVPYFSQQRFTEGIEEGLAAIMQVARLEVIPEESRPEICRH